MAPLGPAERRDAFASRGVRPRQPCPPAETPSAPLYAKSRALVIGIDVYEDAPNQPLTFANGTRFGRLDNAKNDAWAVAQLLREEFEFEEVIELYDEQATRAAIESHLRDILPASTGIEDRLVIFFAGHGYTQKGIHAQDVGHLLTHGAQYFSQAISMDDLRNWFKTIPAKHILLLLDCCFSGSVAFTEPFAARRIWEGGSSLELMTNKTSWQVLTAGQADELVADSGIKPGHSVFTAALLDGLGGAADTNQDGVITGRGLGEYVRRRVVDETQPSGKTQEPIFRELLNGAVGNSVFLTRRRRLQDQLGRELLQSIQETGLPLPLFVSAFESVCQVRGRNSLLVNSSPAAYLSELWSWGEAENEHSPILLFAMELARRHEAILQVCEEWQQRALAESALGLHWPDMPVLPPIRPLEESAIMVPVLTVSLDPVNVAPDTPPEQNSFKANIYFWRTQRPVVVDKIWSLSEAQAEVRRVIRAISQTYPQYSTKLSVEFCLPLELISTACDEWPKHTDLMGSDSVSIGWDHPVMVRSIDGLKSISRRPRWQEKWESFKACYHGHPHPTGQAICRAHEYQPGAIYTHYQHSTVHCLGLTETPPAQLGMRTPLTEMLEAGIPVALWPRPANPGALAEEHIHQAIHTLLHDGTLDGLPIRVMTARSQAQNGDVARHLTLFWDDYDRIPPFFRELEEEAFDDYNL